MRYLDRDLNASLKFDMPLVADVVKLLNATVGSSNFTLAWESLKARMIAGLSIPFPDPHNRWEAKVASVRHSPSLLGYYICDDCDNAATFPPKKMAQLYQVRVRVQGTGYRVRIQG